jgi:hypothetical protein
MVRSHLRHPVIAAFFPDPLNTKWSCYLTSKLGPSLTQWGIKASLHFTRYRTRRMLRHEDAD